MLLDQPAVAVRERGERARRDGRRLRAAVEDGLLRGGGRVQRGAAAAIGRPSVGGSSQRVRTAEREAQDEQASGSHGYAWLLCGLPSTNTSLFEQGV